jgi:hypothetical protein
MLDHLRPTEADYPGGVYRVVGTGSEAVVLLRVGDAEGRRVHSGELVTVDTADLDGFEDAEDPSGNRSVGRALFSALEAAAFSFRSVAGSLAANPLPAAVSFALLLAGIVGESVLPVPNIVLTAFVFLGALGIGFVGSGRLDSRRSDVGG